MITPIVTKRLDTVPPLWKYDLVIKFTKGIKNVPSGNSSNLKSDGPLTGKSSEINK